MNNHNWLFPLDDQQKNRVTYIDLRADKEFCYGSNWVGSCGMGVFNLLENDGPDNPASNAHMP